MRLRTVLLSCSALMALTACDPGLPTNWIPHGYKYQDDSPVTTPAPTQGWVNSSVITDTEGIAASTVAWQGAVFELTDKLSAGLPPGSGPLVLQARQPAGTAQKQALDHYLRQALIQRGYQLSTVPGSGTLVTYDALSLENEGTRDWVVKNLGPEAVPGTNMKEVYLLRATATTPKGEPLTDQSVVAVLQGEKKEYMRWPGLGQQPTQGKALEKKPVYETRD